MSKVRTITGYRIDLLNPRPENIQILDIAHGLAMQCRFAGQINEFYSIAQHSVMVSRLVPPEDAMWGLLHDASEAYICDLPGPLKGTPLLTGYRMVEGKLMEAIATRFRLPAQMPQSVKDADRVALATEFRDIKGCRTCEAAWLAKCMPASSHIVVAGWADARREFLARYNELLARWSGA